MILNKLKNMQSIPELITTFTAFIFIIQISYKVGYLFHFGVWTISLYSPLDIIFSNVFIILIYLMVFMYIIFNDESIIPIVLPVILFTSIPNILDWIAHGKITTIPIDSFLIILATIGISGLRDQKIITVERYEITVWAILLVLIPLGYGMMKFQTLEIKKLPRLEVEISKSKTETWYILDKMNDSFLLTNIEKQKLRIQKIEKTGTIEIR